jgi:putative glycosyltransferase (TIGR04372 family)
MDLLDLFPTHLSFTQAEEQRGLLELGDLGIEPGAPLVCFHARDSAYLDRARPRNVELYGDWSWQNIRDTSIDNYLPAAVKLADLGYYAIRMGKYVREPLHCDHPRVIDYASRFQSDFMDVFLSARCDFFIGQGSGMTALPMTFRRPIAFVNSVPLYEISYCAYCSYHKAIFIPKILYSAAKGRPLTFQEILEFGMGNFSVRNPRHKEISDRLGLEIRENSPEEIAEVALEMHQRLRSIFNSSEEDEELQERFISIIRAYPHIVPLGKDRLVRVGTKFLRAHRDLLG